MLEAIYKKGGVFKYPNVFEHDNGSEFKSDVAMLIFEEQEKKYKGTLIQLLWKPLTKSW